MTIRLARPTDRPELLQLVRDFDADTQAVLPPMQAQFRMVDDPEQAFAEQVSEYFEPHFTTYVASDDGTLVGYICGQIKLKPHRRYGKEGYVHDFFIRTPFRKHGLGQQLFDHLLADFMQQACTHLALSTHIENTNAIKFYERQGLVKRTVTFIKPL